MTFVDTNYFLRFFLKNNQEQFLGAQALFESAASGKTSLFTSVVVIFEIYWVLTSVYKFERSDILITLQSVMTMDFIIIENKEILIGAIRLYSQAHKDLEDCYNLAFAQKQKAEAFATFDQQLEKLFVKKI